MPKEAIELKSRNGSKHKLVLLLRKDNQPSTTYQIKTDADFYRVGKTGSNKNFIDLDGGPMIIEGQKIDGIDVPVKSINFSDLGYTVSFEKTIE